MNLHLVLLAPVVASVLTLFLSGRDAASTLRAALFFALVVAGASFVPLALGETSTELHTWLRPVGGLTVRWGLSSDGLSGWLVALTGVLVPVALVTGRAHVGERLREFAAAVFFLQAGLVGVFLSVDLLQFYAFFEVILLPATVLIAMFGGRERRRAALLFLLFSLAGSIPLFVSIWWMAAEAVRMQMPLSLDLESVRVFLATVDPQVRFWLFAAASLAFLVKLPVVPLHLWQADAYSEGPAAGSALLTGVMAKVGLYGFMRIVLPLFPAERVQYQTFFVVVGLVTMLAGALIALRQREVRRVLAFSSLSHLGLGLAALFTFRPEAIAGVAILIVAHGLSAAALFFLTGIAEGWAKSRHIDDFGSLAKRAPLFAVLFAFAGLASVGLPGTAGFVAEFLMLFSLWKVFGVGVALVAGSTVVLSAAYTLRLLQKMLFGASHSHVESSPDVPALEAFAVAPLLVALLVFGFMPGPILKAGRADLLTRLPSAQAKVVEDASHAAAR
ncbi:MAG: NADH-quinone oxidoreductase subunit M [Fibrobacteres bacterium]|nr:NADH-quinone oxidoreductase subunit M [Fibrobacterota bacterium]